MTSGDASPDFLSSVQLMRLHWSWRDCVIPPMGLQPTR